MLLDAFYSDHHCLFSGPLHPDLEVAAPYLIRLDHGSAKTQRFITQAWGNNWGVFLKCGAGLKDLRSHLRALVMVRDPKGRPLLFRYYDPRVLKRYLPTCTPNELQTVFGDIDCFWMEDETPNEHPQRRRRKRSTRDGDGADRKRHMNEPLLRAQ